MSVKYHLKDDGTPAVCKAKNGNCPKTTEDGSKVPHFDSEAEARNFFESSMENHFLPVPPDKKSAQTSYEYGVASIIEGHLHNSSNIGNDLELFYYSSPAGKMELERRMSNPYREKYYKGIKEKLEENRENLSKSIFERKGYDLEKIKESTERGLKKLSKDFGEADEVFFLERREEPKDNDRRLALTELSKQWYSKLTSEQQESVGNLTSDGFTALGFGVKDFEKDSDRQYALRKLVSKEEMLEMMDEDLDSFEEREEKLGKERSEAYRKTVLEALDKLPEIDEPVMIYRGTSTKELWSIIGSVDDDDEMFSKIESGKLGELEMNSETALKKIPESATTSPTVALRFGALGENKAYIEIKTKKPASPVINGAWGSTEEEIMTNPLSNYKVKDLRAKKNEEGDIFFILSLEEQ